MPAPQFDFLGLAALITALGGVVKILFDSRANGKKYADLLKRFKALEQEHLELNKSFEDLTGLLGKSDQKADNLQRTVDRVKEAFRSLNEKYNTLTAQYKELQAKYDGLKAQYEKLCDETGHTGKTGPLAETGGTP